MEVYAVDFDGFLCENAWPGIGPARPEVIQHFRDLRGKGNKLILWTCREGRPLAEAIVWCAERDLVFDAVNANLPERIDQYKSDPRKVGADYYCDDRNYILPELGGKKLKIILFSGKAEAGKTLAANLTKAALEAAGKRAVIAPYGAYVKNTATMLFGWDGQKNAAGRELLQHWGTDLCRKKDPDFWADTLTRLAPMLEDDFDYLLIDDARFPNEIECWQKRGYATTSVRIERPGHKSRLTREQLAHPSETALDRYAFDYRIVAEDKPKLEAAVADLVGTKLPRADREKKEDA